MAFGSFISFAAVQLFVAFVANSKAMIGDSTCMVVDAFTYGCNLFAERRKKTVSEKENSVDADSTPLATTPDNINEFEYKKRRRLLILELVPPLLSVSILTIINSISLHGAINALVLVPFLDTPGNKNSHPNLLLMLIFSTLNLSLDIVNMTCFARARHLMGYNTINSIVELKERNVESKNNLIHINPNSLDESEDIDEDDRANLNMCSAYTVCFWMHFCLQFSVS